MGPAARSVAWTLLARLEQLIIRDSGIRHLMIITEGVIRRLIFEYGRSGVSVWATHPDDLVLA